MIIARYLESYSSKFIYEKNKSLLGWEFVRGTRGYCYYGFCRFVDSNFGYIVETVRVCVRVHGGISEFISVFDDIFYYNLILSFEFVCNQLV